MRRIAFVLWVAVAGMGMCLGCAVASPCGVDGDCPASTSCVDGRCVGGAGTPVLARDASAEGAWADIELDGGEEGDGDPVVVPPPGGDEQDRDGAPTFLYGFTHRRPITLRADAVPGFINLKEFPLLVRIQADELRHVTNGGFVNSQTGGDIAFFTNEGMTELLPHDRVSYDGATGSFEAWIRVDLSPYDDEEIMMAYGRDDIVGSTSSSVWSAYGTIWHLDGNANDAKGVNDGDAQNLEAEDILPGRVGQGRRFDGGSEAIRVPCGTLGGSFSVTVEGWGKLEATTALSGFPRLFHMGGENDRVLELMVTDDSAGADTARFRVNHDATGANPFALVDINHGEWHHYAGVLNGVTGYYTLYVDGERLYDVYYGGSIPTEHGSCFIGNWDAAPLTPRNWHGVVDEVRISRRARPQEWFMTLVANVNDPDRFVSVGADQTP